MATVMGQAPQQPGNRRRPTRARRSASAFRRPHSARLTGGAAQRRTGAELTWPQYAVRVRRIAGGLAALGVRHGDTVALMLTNRIEFYPVRHRRAASRGDPVLDLQHLLSQQISYLSRTRAAAS